MRARSGALWTFPATGKSLDEGEVVGPWAGPHVRLSMEAERGSDELSRRLPRGLWMGPLCARSH